MPADGPATFERLIAEGLVQPAREPKRTAPRPITASGPVTELVTEQRR